MVTTPGSVVLSKGSAALPIQCTKDCSVMGSSVIPSNIEAMAAGNVIFGASSRGRLALALSPKLTHYAPQSGGVYEKDHDGIHRERGGIPLRWPRSTAHR